MVTPGSVPGGLPGQLGRNKRIFLPGSVDRIDTVFIKDTIPYYDSLRSKDTLIQATDTIFSDSARNRNTTGY
ncbi:hypothetical protein [Niabella hibiscisoli]|uniref:hypothetical protein n=1 Tax=Niabella hibiscisoli TaxID=1825928 RepID=UPI001F0DEF9E|nr:hypothetical protein [Niabella hibiscisoli]MCH5719146.1 hypothetical protein [Niabella hibiscisoli]